MTPMTIVQIAQRRGSSATTRAGAWRYLLAHLQPAPIAGRLAQIGHGWGSWQAPHMLDHAMGAQSVRSLSEPVRRRLILWLARGVITDREHVGCGLKRENGVGQLVLDHAAMRRRMRGRRLEAAADAMAAQLGVSRRDEDEARAKACDHAYLAPIAAVLRADWPFRRSQSSWVGGEHTVTLTSTLDSPAASGVSETVWHPKHTWRGTNSTAYLTCTRRALARYPMLRAPGGEIVLDAEPVLEETRTERVVIVRQGRGVSLRMEQGWLIRGYYSPAVHLARAQREAAAARAKTLAVRLQSRHQRREAASVYVSVEDSLRAGNCPTQTAAYAERLWRKMGAVGPCAVRGDILLHDRDDLFTRRAVAAAAVRVANVEVSK